MNESMRAYSSILFASVAVFLGACSSYDHSFIKDVADLPLKSTSEPSTNWSAAPLRSHAKYVLYGAESKQEMEDCVGDYYFVTWYDAEPSKKAKLVMRYTQAATGAKELRSECVYPVARSSAQTRTERFFFTGDERRAKGDVLTWRMELYVDGKLVDSKQSYLWE